MKMRWWLAAVLLVPAAGLARADAPIPHFGPGPRYRPSPPIPVHPANAVPVVIEASDTVTEPRLVIPRPLLARAKKLVPERSAARPSAAPTVAAGLALTAALSAAGLCLARRKGRALAVMLVLGGVCAFGAGRAFLVAQPPQPPNLPPPPPLEVQFDHAAVEVVERGTEVRLLVPRARLGELTGKPR